MNSLRPFRFACLAALVVGVGLSRDARAQSSALAPTTPPKTQVVAVIGASVSAGVDMRSEMAHQTGMSAPAGPSQTVTVTEILRAVWRVDGAPGVDVRDFSDKFVFLLSDVEREAQMARALQAKPSLVIAIDYLFWFGYGPLTGVRDEDGVMAIPTDEQAKAQRLAHLERGLAILDRCDVPILVGDFPDMSNANRLVLNPAWRPDTATLTALNQRVTDYAKKRPNVRVFPLAERVAELQTKAYRIEHDGVAYEAQRKELFQFDMLHPNRVGMAVLGEHLLAAINAIEALPAPLRTAKPSASELVVPLAAVDQLKRSKKVMAEAGATGGGTGDR
jgi:hypothetical protein